MKVERRSLIRRSTDAAFARLGFEGVLLSIIGLMIGLATIIVVQQLIGAFDQEASKDSSLIAQKSQFSLILIGIISSSAMAFHYRNTQNHDWLRFSGFGMGFHVGYVIHLAALYWLNDYSLYGVPLLASSLLSLLVPMFVSGGGKNAGKPHPARIFD